MTLKEILQLPKDAQSLSILKTYLNQPLDYHDHLAAFSHYIKVLYALKSFRVLMEETELFFDRFLTLDFNETMDHMMHVYIESALETEQFDKASKMIQSRKTRLPLLKHYVIFEQEYQYLKNIGSETSQWVKDQLQDHVPHTYAFIMKRALIDIYIKEHHEEQALEVIHHLEEEYHQHIFHIHIQLLDTLKKYNEIIELYKTKYRQDYIQQDIYYLVKAYMHLGEEQKVINLEVDYEVLMDAEHPYKMQYYELLLSFYERIQNALSIKIYQQKLKALKSQEKVVKLPPIKQEQKVQVELVQPAKNQSVQIIERMHKVIASFLNLHNNLSFRDELRLKLSLLNEVCSFETFVMYIPTSRMLYFFKKERLYDKKVKPEQLEQTFLKSLLQSKKEGVIEAPLFEEFKDVLTSKQYANISHIYAYHMNDASLLFYYEQKMQRYAEDDDVLRMASNYLSYALKTYQVHERHSRQEKILTLLLEHANIPLRYYFQGRFYNSKALKIMLNLEDEETIQSYLEKVVFDNQKDYQRQLNDMLQLKQTDLKLTYGVGKKMVQENIQLSKIDSEVMLISTFEDLNEQLSMQSQIETNALKDPLTQIMNYNAFQRDFQSLIKHKVTFILIDLQPQLIYLYGLQKYHAYFKDFCHETIKFFSEDQLYLYNDHQLIAILPGNDIRSVEKHLALYQNKMSQSYAQSISSESFHIHIGYLRYPVASKNQDIQTIMHYLLTALFQAKRAPTKRHDFQYIDYENDMKEQYILDQIHHAINHTQFEIGFHQIIDQSSNKMWMYESFIYLSNLQVSHHDLILIAKKRQRLFDLDMAHFKVVLEMLVELYQHTQSYIKMIVPMDAETIKHSKFNTYMTRFMMQYKIPKHIIHINITGDLKASTYINLFKDLSGLGIGIQTSSLKVALYYPVEALHFDIKYPDKKMIHYLKSIQSMMATFQIDFVLRNILNREVKQELLKEKLHYIEGPIYKKLTKQHVFDKVKNKMSN